MANIFTKYIKKRPKNQEPERYSESISLKTEQAIRHIKRWQDKGYCREKIKMKMIKHDRDVPRMLEHHCRYGQHIFDVRGRKMRLRCIPIAKVLETIFPNEEITTPYYHSDYAEILIGTTAMATCINFSVPEREMKVVGVVSDEYDNIAEATVSYGLTNRPAFAGAKTYYVVVGDSVAEVLIKNIEKEENKMKLFNTKKIIEDAIESVVADFLPGTPIEDIDKAAAAVILEVRHSLERVIPYEKAKEAGMLDDEDNVRIKSYISMDPDIISGLLVAKVAKMEIPNSLKRLTEDFYVFDMPYNWYNDKGDKLASRAREAKELVLQEGEER